jgi:hypothetical protein
MLAVEGVRYSKRRAREVVAMAVAAAARARAAEARAEAAREGVAGRATAVVAVAMVKAAGARVGRAGMARARATKGTVWLNQTAAVEGARVAASWEAALRRPDAEAAGGLAGEA